MSGITYTLNELAEKLSAKVQGDGLYRVHSLATLQDAKAGQLSFIANPRYQQYLKTTSAGAVIISTKFTKEFSGNALVVDDPYLTYARASQLFSSQSIIPKIADSVVIPETAMFGDSVQIDEGVVLGENVTIGDHVCIGPNTVIGANSEIGAHTRIEANVTLYHDVRVGSSCLIHSGAVVGADGFGFANDAGGWVKIAQLGSVVIGDNVEIGACTTIDRGALGDTVIGNGVILDNQIQIAHNVIIGENSAIAGCTAVAGSTKIGAGCTIAGACGITGHLSIADGTHITAMTLVTKSIGEPGAYSSGTGMLPHKQWKKNVVRFRQLDDMARRLKLIEDKLSED